MRSTSATTCTRDRLSRTPRNCRSDWPRVTACHGSRRSADPRRVWSLPHLDKGWRGGLGQPNMRKWWGDHGAYDYKQTSGTLIAGRPIFGGSADIMDIAPTVLKYFGVPIPSEIDGKPIF